MLKRDAANTFPHVRHTGLKAFCTAAQTEQRTDEAVDDFTSSPYEGPPDRASNCPIYPAAVRPTFFNERKRESARR
ncbi:protein of unknown function [Nitrospira japonica]|uniref:Uncharacterized protein n=1 Tax=Nitrospira japonica TaxID=1325564 RepID=A0A1W1I231_9BACT|nr:protein of unknown function [Nitrospira japonica]